MATHHKLGQLLLREGLIEPEQLDRALAERERTDSRLGRILVSRGMLAEEDLIRVLAGQLRVPVARIRGKTVKPDVLRRVPQSIAEKYRCLPLFLRDEPGGPVLFLALEDPTDREALDELAFQLGERLRPVLIGPTELSEALSRHYALPASNPALGPLAQAAPPSPPRMREPDTAPQLPQLTPLPANGAFTSEDTAPELGALAAAPLPDPDTAPRVSAGDTLPGDTLPGLASGETAPGIEPGDATLPDSASGNGVRPGPLEPRVILRALAQLLVEKGVIGRDELAERLRAMAAEQA